jgi:hypothetical protein
MSTTIEVGVDQALVLRGILRELGYRQFGPGGDCSVFAHRDLPVVIVPHDPAMLTAARLRAILQRIDMSEAEWQERVARG